MFQSFTRTPFFRSIAVTVIVAFLSLIPAQTGFAQVVMQMPAPGQMLNLSPRFEPALMAGMRVDFKDPFSFYFIMNKGEKPMTDDVKKEEYQKLIKYFLASLTTDNKDMWVNLSPHESSRIIPDNFSQTSMGRDLLAQDYLLKQFTASLIYPEEEIGKEFWKKIYQQAYEKYGTTDVPIDTFNKVWIVADKASIYQKSDTAFLVDSHLKVMLEQDFMAIEKNKDQFGNAAAADVSEGALDDARKLASDIVREIIVPAIEKEVNEGTNFAQVRQIYSAMIMATWFKRTLKESLLGQVYVNKNKVAGIEVDDLRAKDKIYQQYLSAYKVGVFNYIKEEVDLGTQETLPRKYFSGGILSMDSAMLTAASVLQAAKVVGAKMPRLDAAMVSLQSVKKAFLTGALVFTTLVASGAAFGQGAQASGTINDKPITVIVDPVRVGSQGAILGMNLQETEAAIAEVSQWPESTKRTGKLAELRRHRDALKAAQPTGETGTVTQTPIAEPVAPTSVEQPVVTGEAAPAAGPVAISETATPSFEEIFPTLSLVSSAENVQTAFSEVERLYTDIKPLSQRVNSGELSREDATYKETAAAFARAVMNYRLTLWRLPIDEQLKSGEMGDVERMYADILPSIESQAETPQVEPGSAGLTQDELALQQADKLLKTNQGNQPGVKSSSKPGFAMVQIVYTRTVTTAKDKLNVAGNKINAAGKKVVEKVKNLAAVKKATGPTISAAPKQASGETKASEKTSNLNVGAIVASLAALGAGILAIILKRKSKAQEVADAEKELEVVEEELSDEESKAAELAKTSEDAIVESLPRVKDYIDASKEATDLQESFDDLEGQLELASTQLGQNAELFQNQIDKIQAERNNRLNPLLQQARIIETSSSQSKKKTARKALEDLRKKFNLNPDEITVAALEARDKELQAQLKVLRGQRSAAPEVGRTAIAEIADLEGQIEALRVKINDVIEAQAQIAAELIERLGDEKMAELEDAIGQIAGVRALKADRDEAKAGVRELPGTVAQYDAQIAALEARIGELKQTESIPLLKQGPEEASRIIERLKKEKAEKEAALAAEKKTRGANKGASQKRQAALNKRIAKIDETLAQVAVLGEKTGAVDILLSDAQAEHQALVAARTAVQDELAVMQGRIDDYQGEADRVAALVASLDRLVAKGQTLSSDNETPEDAEVGGPIAVPEAPVLTAAQEESIAKLEVDIRESTTLIEELKRKLDAESARLSTGALKSRIAALKKDRDTLEALIGNLEKLAGLSYAKQEKAISGQIEQAKKFLAQRYKIRDTANARQKHLDALNKLIGDLEAERDGQEAEVEKLKQQIGSEEQKVQTAEKALASVAEQAGETTSTPKAPESLEDILRGRSLEKYDPANFPVEDVARVVDALSSEIMSGLGKEQALNQELFNEIDQLAKDNPSIRIGDFIDLPPVERANAVRDLRDALNNQMTAIVKITARRSAGGSLDEISDADILQVDGIPRIADAKNGDITQQVLTADGYIKEIEEKLKALEQPVGGIDLGDENLILNIKADKQGMPLPMQFQDPAMINIQGLSPIIREIAPVSPANIPVLSELMQMSGSNA